MAGIQPNFPLYELISPDGRMGARADLEGIDVFEMDSGKLAAHIDVALPDCQYGWDRYFSFNQDGSFIAVAGKDAIQVWQVGSGVIYESPYKAQTGTDADTCGAEIPQLALSPDAGLLAISGVTTGSTSAQAYFRVVATLQNQVVYEWNESQDTLHGDLYTFRGLGFSSDGTVLQTFDPSRYQSFSGEEYQAFRFWAVGTWQELSRSMEALNGFQAADQYYVLQGDESIQLKSRLDGQVRASLGGTGCTQTEPCDARLSLETNTVALLNISKATLTYHREVIATQMAIWDWQSGKQLARAEVFMRNLDGVLPAEDGGYQTTADFGVAGTAPSNWWTSSYNFDGLLGGTDLVSFRPQVIDLSAQSDCYYCSTCSLNPADLQISCQNAYFSQESNLWKVANKDGQISLQSVEGGGTFDLKLPADAQADWDLRLLGFSEEFQTAFYCLDKGGRSQICAIAMGGDRDKLTEMEDIFGLRFSADGSTAAYIDRREKALFLLNLQSGKLTKMDAYQSRAWFVNPAFTSTDSEMVYVVQNLSDQTLLSLEWVDGAQAKVLRRSTLDTDTIDQPSALSLGAENGLVALGASDGWIFVLDQEKGKIVTSWQAGSAPIIGLAFAEGDEVLVSLDEQGNIRIWGVE
ncbi:hypothetical protein Pelsub_P0018 [Pelolinea submarina]|nr:hypothetical protein Pelsub_P0018 [Pelolinea submarina]